MHKRLNPTNFPHFMERTHKTYRSGRPLGRIYDRVKTIRFDPIYDMAFDARVLSRFELSTNEISKAREIKSKYDIAMRRLMGRHENVVTEFEIWSAFILSKPRVGNDYKLQEEVGRDVAALKDRFRSVCGEAVTGVERKDSLAVFSYSMIDLEKLDRFVAAMYTVTYDEVQAALRARSMPIIDDDGNRVANDQGYSYPMPLVSFPWLFHRELSRIATGGQPPERQWKLPSHENKAANAVSLPQVTSQPSDGDGGAISSTTGEYLVAGKKEGSAGEDEDCVRTSSGQVVHRGETLDLFGKATEEFKELSSRGDGTENSLRATDSPRITISSASSASELHALSAERSERSRGEDSEDEIEFEEMEIGNNDEEEDEEEDALDVLTRKIGGTYVHGGGQTRELL